MKAKKVIESTKHVAKITAAILGLQDKGLLKINTNSIALNSAVLYNEKIAKNIMRNCYLYMRLTNKIPKNSDMDFFNLETDELVGTFTNGKSLFFANP